MVPTATWLLLTTLSFTNGLTTLHQESLKNQDSIDLTKSDYKYSYMFEKKRTDETPQAEKREEEIGKYMLHEQKVAYTTLEPQPSDIENFKEKTKSQSVSQAPIHHLYQNNHKIEKSSPPMTPAQKFQEYRKKIHLLNPTDVSEAPIHHLYQNHNKIEKSSTTMPPAQKLQEYRKEVHSLNPTRTWENMSYLPPLPKKNPTLSVTPKWEELNDILKYHPNLKLSVYALKISPHRHHRHKNPATTSVAPVEKTVETKHDFTQKPIYSTPSSRGPSTKAQLNHDLPTTIRPKLIKIKKDLPARRAHQLVNRGSYRFRLDDVNDMRQ